MRTATFRVSVGLLLSAHTLSAQTTWSASAHAAPIRIVGAQSAELRAPHDTVELPDGDYAVHFAADSLGKPGSLLMALTGPCSVQTAIERAEPVETRVVPIDDEAWQLMHRPTSPLPTHSRTYARLDLGDGRVSVTVQSGAASAIGLLARFTDDDHRYRLLWDVAERQLRLERRLGPGDMVLCNATAPASMNDGKPHTLTLQVHGFRLTAFVDDQLVLQAFDGALTHGAVGVAWRGEEPSWQRFVVEPVAAARGSAALVTKAGAAELHVSTTVSPGHYHVVELLLDRPHALLPRNASGQELWLLQPPAAPRILLADWRESLGAGSIGEVAERGLLAGQLAWPELPLLRHQVALVRALLVSADGEAIADSSPAVALVF